ncbi:hypothetical protein O6H91_12G057700 [Diphasiastrum complanatum]|uniref:Uncharacterized protein n=1 Tax=Diphasiastrum complanatum TaxID=34168 RepID=A0ACC2C268_DIPCM|nr:hypothetical protein O6H91_12G057700 [Diphasiastrum complanatum]
MVKYGEQANSLYQKILTCFQAHLLAAVIGGSIYVAHEELFRQCEVPTLTPSNSISDSKIFLGHARRSSTLGTLEDLAKASRGILDSSEVGSNAILGDILWSDPSPNPGLEFNMARDIGLLFGLDCT